MRIEGDTTIPAVLLRAARTFTDTEALVDPAHGIRLTYRQLHERVRTVARAFIAEGIEPGDRVAICSPNTHHWVAAALGALYAGATLMPINTRFTGPEMLDILDRSGARALVVAGPFLNVDRLAELRKTGPLPVRIVLRVPVDGEVPAEDDVLDWADLDGTAATVPVQEADRRAAGVTPDQVSDILFTSGTTGRGKGVCSAHRQAVGVAAAWAERGELTEADRYLVINPFFHSFGYKAGILACLCSGATIVPQAVFDVGTAMDLVARERITVLPGPPTIYQSILDHPDRAGRDLSSLRLAVTGAAIVPVALIERMRSELHLSRVLTAYGLTEAVVVTMCRAGDDAETVATTCGTPIPGCEVRIADTGEVLVRGRNVMLGYLDDPEATAAAIDADGWLHTGDIGVLDERGYLRITDRLKDMYICGGFNVYPAEIEQVLAGLPGVADVAVIGVPDHRLGEVGKAFIEPADGSALSEQDVVGFCRSRLANYKVPRFVEFRAELPRNASGKILKRTLRGENA